MKRYFLLWLLFLGGYAARGQEGRLDPTFGGTGWAPLNFATSGNAYNDYGRKLLVQSDGKYIVLLETSYYYHVLARYTADGVLDKSFGNGGFSYPIDLGYNFCAVVQADDNIVVGGYSYNTSQQAVLALKRYTRDGALDESFGSGGVATAGLVSYAVTEALSLSVQGTGEIIAVGQGLDENSQSRAFVVTRFTSTGALDPAFNAGAPLALDVGTYYATAATAVALQGTNIIVGGEGVEPTSGQAVFTLVRLASNGTVDETFGTQGWVRTPFAAGAKLTSLALQAGGEIVAGGYVYNTTTQDNDFALARYTAEGVLEGTSTTDLGSDDYATGLALGPGQIVLVGYRQWYSEGNYPHDIALVRYTGSGDLDESFDGDGRVVTTLEGDDDARSALMLAGGSLLVAGSSFTTNTQTADILLARYRNDGTLDNTFNAGDATPGIALSYYSHGIQAEIRDMVVQPDGKVVVAGVSLKDVYSWYSNNFGVARFNPDGTLDASFGNGGVAVVDFGPSAGASSVALQADGKIVVGGSVGYDDDNGQWQSDFALARFTREGLPDPTFDGDGKAIIDLYSNDYLVDMAVLPDGKIIGAGASYNDVNPEGGYFSSDFAVVRFTPDGKVDRRFGNGGLVTTDFFGDYDHVASVAVQPDGRILVSGLVYNSTSGSTSSAFAVVRYNSNGVLDTRFGTGGKALVRTGTALGGGMLALQGDGKILLGGTVLQDPENSTSDFSLVRFTSAGVLDATFGDNGLVTTDFGGTSEYAGPVVLQSDGKILLVGGYYTHDPQTDVYGDYFVVARYLNDGTHDGALDATFDGDGKAAVTFPGAALSGGVAWYNDRVYFSGYWQMPDAAAAVASTEWPPNFFESSFVAALRASSATPPLPVISITDATVVEGELAVLNISLTSAAGAPLTLNYATQDGTATSKGKNPDYKSMRGLVTIDAGATTATITIPTYANGPEAMEQIFYVTLSLGRRMETLAVMGDGEAKVTILQTPPVTRALTVEETPTGPLTATVYPNPTSSFFTLQWHSGSATPVTIQVTDASGRVVEAKAGVAANATLQLGHSYRPGVYYVEVQQGTAKQTLKVVKGAQ